VLDAVLVTYTKLVKGSSAIKLAISGNLILVGITYGYSTLSVMDDGFTVIFLMFL
jgi:hypothetical protein